MREFQLPKTDPAHPENFLGDGEALVAANVPTREGMEDGVFVVVALDNGALPQTIELDGAGELKLTGDKTAQSQPIYRSPR